MRRRKLAALWIISRTKIIIENIEMDTLRSLDLGLIQINSKEKSGTAPEKFSAAAVAKEKQRHMIQNNEAVRKIPVNVVGINMRTGQFTTSVFQHLAGFGASKA